MQNTKPFSLRFSGIALRNLWNGFISLLKEKLYLRILCLFILFVAVFLMTGFNRTPYTYIFNFLLIVFCICSFVIVFHEESFRFDSVSLFFVLYFLVIFTNSLINKTFVLTPYANCFIGFFIYQLAATSNKRFGDLLLFSFFLGLCGFSIVVLLHYLPAIRTGGLSIRIGDYFGSADGLGAVFSLLIFISLYYLSKGNLIALLPCIFGMFLLVLSQTRTAFIAVSIAFFLFLYSLFHGKNKYIFWLLLFLSIFFFLFLLQLPLFSGIKNRFEDMFLELLGKGTDESGSERFSLILRSIIFSFTHPLYGYGFSGILRYSFQASHDLIGDLSLYYGGIFSFFSFLLLTFVSISFLKNKNDYKLLLMFTSVFFFVNIFLGIIFSSRLITSFFSLSLGLSVVGKNGRENINSPRAIHLETCKITI